MFLVVVVVGEQVQVAQTCSVSLESILVQIPFFVPLKLLKFCEKMIEPLVVVAIVFAVQQSVNFCGIHDFARLNHVCYQTVVVVELLQMNDVLFESIVHFGHAFVVVVVGFGMKLMIETFAYLPLGALQALVLVRALLLPAQQLFATLE